MKQKLEGLLALLALLLLTTLLIILEGCASPPPPEPPLNRIGDQFKRTGTLVAHIPQDAGIHEVDPIAVKLSAVPTPSILITFGAVVFSQPSTSSTSIAMVAGK